MISILGKAKKILIQFGQRLLAALLSTGVRQLLVLPLLAARFSDAEYGTILTIVSIANIIELALGNTLNNTRLITHKDYRQQNLTGDFQPLLLIAAGVASLVSLVLPLFFPQLDFLTGLLLWLVIVSNTLSCYYIVHFVVTLQFHKTLIQSAVTAAGTVLGLLLALWTGLWPFCFLMGSVACLVYLWFSTPLMREPLQWTPRRASTTRRWIILILNSLLSNALIYLDRLLLYPVLGAVAVANYATAAFFGKCAASVMPPVANVLLGHFSQEDFQMNRKKFLLIVAGSVSFALLAFLASMLLGPWLTKLFYPSLIDAALPLLPLANLAACVGIGCTLLQTVVFRFCPPSRLLLVQIIYGVIYFGGSLFLLPVYGITGFCWVAVCANIVRLILFFVLGFHRFKKTPA